MAVYFGQSMPDVNREVRGRLSRRAGSAAHRVHGSAGRADVAAHAAAAHHRAMTDPITVTCDIRWGDLDALGHVNNTVFFRFFEEARIALLDRVGLRALRQATGTGPILAATSCQFRLPLSHPDTVTCHAGVTRIGTTSFTVEYLLKSAAKGVVATGDSVVVHYDYDRQTKAPIPDTIRAALLALPALG